MSEVSEETKLKAFKLCKDFLGGAWKALSVEDFHIEHISGGLSNLLYMCAIKPDKRPAPSLTSSSSANKVPNTVMLRIYGKIIQENPETVVTDSVIFALLAERGMGPKLYGVFTEGRVEEYIPSRHLHTKELSDPVISQECARKMAAFHHLHMPLNKEPVWLFDTMHRYLNEALNNLTFDNGDSRQAQSIQKLISYNLAEEEKSLVALLSRVPSPVVLCHNDLQEGNILLPFDKSRIQSKSGDNLMLIDYEYSQFNYRGFDFGNHFCEWCYCYDVNAPPYYHADISAYPSREQQLSFFRAYLNESGGLGEGENQADVEEAMLLEANAFALASHFFWGLWSIVQSNISNISFDYMEYALVRFEHYFHQKKTLPATLQVNGV